MVKNRAGTGTHFILLTVLGAMILDVLPLPREWLWYRPEWVLLVVIYWVVLAPTRVGIGAAWLTGLIMDLILGSHLGLHCLTLAIAAYLCLIFQQQLRLYSIFQQMLLLFPIILLHVLLGQWAQGIGGGPSMTWYALLPTLTSVMVWPLVVLLLERLTRPYVVIA